MDGCYDRTEDEDGTDLTDDEEGEERGVATVRLNKEDNRTNTLCNCRNLSPC